MKSAKGAALIEYMPLLAAVGIILPVFLIFGSQIPRLFEDPPAFEVPGGEPEIVEIPDCVFEGNCPIPPRVTEYCFENTVSGESCDIIPYTLIDVPGDDTFLIFEQPTDTDPRLQWVLEDLNLGVYANSPDITAFNQADLELVSASTVYHPAGMYCHDRGAALPSYNTMLFLAQNYAAELGLRNNIYLASSQYWVVGGYNPPPVLATLAYARNVSVTNGTGGHGFLTHYFYVRCVYGD